MQNAMYGWKDMLYVSYIFTPQIHQMQHVRVLRMLQDANEFMSVPKLQVYILDVISLLISLRTNIFTLG